MHFYPIFGFFTHLKPYRVSFATMRYDIPGLPADNLGMEALFGRLRSHQRRISGRKSTRELRSFGQCQVLFLADSQSDLLHRMQQVPLDAYKQQRQRLAEAEKPRQFLHRLHRNPLDTTQCLIAQHGRRRQQLDQAPVTNNKHQLRRARI